MKEKNVTIYDIASEAGVSPRTVSRALNNNGYVSQKARERISHIVSKYNYSLNTKAQSLRSKKTNTIIVFIAKQNVDYWSQIYTLIINKLTKLAHQSDYHIIVSDSDPDTFQENQNDGYYLLRNGYADAAVILDSCANDKRVEFMSDLSIPFVTWGREHGNDNITYVYFDNIQAGEIIGTYMKEHQLLPAAAFFGGKRYSATQDRLKGIMTGLEDHSSELTTFFDCVDSEQTYLTAKKELRNFRGVFVSGDERALGIYRAAYELGIKIPTELAVIGFDDIPLAQYLTPPLTTIQQPFNLIARDIFELTLRNIADRGESVAHITHQPRLIIRGST
jgi:DNA-binding LacI/PurR family transcriptional regulator